jgi:hypothetical protein
VNGDPPDLFAELEELEAQLAASRSSLAELRARSPRAGCGDPSHAGAAERISTLEELLAKTRRGKRTTERLAEGRGERLQLEIERMKKEVARVEPLATHGDRALLERLKAAQQRRRLLELKSPRPGTALVPAVSRLSLAGLEESPARGHDPAWIAWLAAVSVAAFWSGTASTGAIVLISTLLSALGLSSWAFPGARRDLITAHLIHGEPWSQVKSILFTPDGSLVIETAHRRQVFSEATSGFRDLVRLTLAAAAAHGLTVTGTPPAS